MYLLSSLDETTSTGVAAFHMLILGLGLGMVMQVLVLVVQNSVPYDMLGVATSGSTLFRSIGGSLGTAILGAIFSGRLAAEVAGGDTQVHAFTDSLHVVFLVAAGVVVIAFLLSWLIPEAPLRKTVDATVVGDTIGGPVDTDSLRELTRALSRAAGRDRTLAFLRGVVERAGVDLSPAASWALLRLGAPEAPTVAELAALPHVRADRLAAAMGQLRDGGLVAGDRVTPAGAELRERLVAARTEGLRELISEWEPDKYPELDGLVRRLADELVPVPGLGERRAVGGGADEAAVAAEDAARHARLRGDEGRQAGGELGVVERDAQLARVGVDRHLLALAHDGQRAAADRLGGDVADHQPARRAGEAAVGDEHDGLAEAGADDGGGDGQHLAHARAARGALVADDQHVAGVDRARGERVDAVVLALEHARRAGVARAARRRRSSPPRRRARGSRAGRAGRSRPSTARRAVNVTRAVGLGRVRDGLGQRPAAGHRARRRRPGRRATSSRISTGMPPASCRSVAT